MSSVEGPSRSLVNGTEEGQHPSESTVCNSSENRFISQVPMRLKFPQREVSICRRKIALQNRLGLPVEQETLYNLQTCATRSNSVTWHTYIPGR